jgi:hypothetical protein
MGTNSEMAQKLLSKAVQTHNPRPWEAEAGVSQVQCQPGAKRETLSQIKERNDPIIFIQYLKNTNI